MAVLACPAPGLPCLALVVLAVLAAVFLTLAARTKCALPLDLPATCRPDLWATAYLPCRPAEVWAERLRSTVGPAGAASSTADQSRSVVSAILADTGAVSLAK